MSRIETVEWDVRIGADTVTGWVLDQAEIAYGRTSLGTQPDAPTLYADLLATRVQRVPELNDPVTIDALVYKAVTDEIVTSRRFTGSIVSVRYNTGTYTIQAVGNGEKLNRVMTGDQPWPQETDVERIRRIFALAPHLTSQILGVSRVSFIARDVDLSTQRSAGDLAREYATQGGGVVTENRNGVLQYLTAAYIADPPTTVAPPATVVVAEDYDLILESGAVLNQIRIGYGVPVEQTAPDGSTSTSQLNVYLEDAESIIRFGPRYSYLGTDLKESNDGNAYGLMILANSAAPKWQMPVVSAEVNLYEDAAFLLDFAQADPGDLMYVSTAPLGAPVTSYTGLVQGWVENCSRKRWRIEYQLVRSDSAPLGTVTWSEPGDSYTWAKQTVAWRNANSIHNLIGA